MHLHWKKHQTLKVVKTFSAEEVKEIAAELARLSGGIVLDIHEDNTIIMYRGKNYSQPPTQIMSPRVSLSRKKALDKSKYRLEQELAILRAQFKSSAESKTEAAEAIQNSGRESIESGKDETDMNSELDSDSDKLSDIFETDSDTENFVNEEKPLNLDDFDNFPEQSNGEMNDFEEHLQQMSLK
ncbi:Putative CRM domain-containing protein, chloroplastic [Glycine soja]|uniref:Putative CRM domain-containing protein, chloroplastic n=1 Tax=Glycine soja TaxID=3848 RepID=A0A0B2PR19_GLYSO|nr:Putative CRM domain-containing protein, chloroplastic [Glycine soja]